MSDNNSTKWADALPLVQFTKNRSYHSGIKRSPYEAMFDRHVKDGLQASSVPEEVTKNLRTEEKLERIIQPAASTIQKSVPTSVEDTPAPEPTSAMITAERRYDNENIPTLREPSHEPPIHCSPLPSSSKYVTCTGCNNINDAVGGLKSTFCTLCPRIESNWYQKKEIEGVSNQSSKTYETTIRQKLS